MKARPGYDALVIGGGIAGLTSAIALERVGLRARILERATALTQAGTALSLWPNALAALSELGLSTALTDIGIEEPGGIIRDWTGREIVTLDQTRLSHATRHTHVGRPQGKAPTGPAPRRVRHTHRHAHHGVAHRLTCERVRGDDIQR